MARLLAAADRPIEAAAPSLEALVVSWKAALERESQRVWAIRGAARDLANNLQHLLPAERVTEEVVNALRAVEEGRAGLRMSLLTNSVDLIAGHSRAGVRGLELWKTIPDDGRATLLHNLCFDRQRLIHRFVTVPDAERDNWIKQKSNLPDWPIALALGYLKFGGDMEKLYRQASLLASVGYEDFEVLVTPQIIEESADSNATREARDLERFLREGAVTAHALRCGGAKLEEISPAEWHYLELRSEFHPQHIFAGDRTKRTKVRIDHIMMPREAVQALVTPKLPSSNETRSSRTGTIRTVPIDSPEKAFLWKLVDHLEINEPQSSADTKTLLLKRLDDEDELTATGRKKIWDAATLLISRRSSEAWTGSGRRPAIASPNAKRIAGRKNNNR